MNPELSKHESDATRLVLDQIEFEEMRQKIDARNRDSKLRVWWITNPPNAPVWTHVATPEDACRLISNQADLQLRDPTVFHNAFRCMQLDNDGEWTEFGNAVAMDIDEIAADLDNNNIAGRDDDWRKRPLRLTPWVAIFEAGGVAGGQHAFPCDATGQPLYDQMDESIRPVAESWFKKEPDAVKLAYDPAEDQ